VPSNPVITIVDDNGVGVYGSALAVVPIGAGTTVISARKGRLVRVVATAAAAGGSVTFYDNASTGTGTVLVVIPGTAVIGAAFDVQMPALNGITAVAAASGAALTVAYS
jgi:hypothetical protein